MTSHDEQLEPLLGAYLDGELSAAEAVEVQRLLEESPECRRLLGELRALREHLRGLPRRGLPADFSEQVVAAVKRRRGGNQHVSDRAAAASVPRGGHTSAADPGHDSPQPTAGRYWKRWRTAAALVATAAVCLLVVWSLPREVPDRPVQDKSTANRQLAQLDTAATAGKAPAAESTEDAAVAPPPAMLATDQARQPTTSPDSSGPERRPAGAVETLVVQPDSPPQPAGGSLVQMNTSEESPATTAAEAARRLRPRVEPLAQPLVLVVEVGLHPAGLSNRAFEACLAACEIPYRTAVDVSEPLSTALLDSRYLKAEQSPGDPAMDNAPLELVYVSAQGMQIDLLLGAILSQREHFASLRLDIAHQPEDVRVFQQLHADLGEDSPARSATDAIQARPLTLPASMRQTLRRESRDVGLIAAESPSNAAAMWPGPQSALTGSETLSFEVLFVLFPAETPER